MMRSSFESLEFELKDKEIFNIPEVRTKLDTLQNYFFPRLEILLKESLREVQEIYGVNPYKTMSPVYQPSHRKNAKSNKDTTTVHIGISGKRNQQELIYRRKNGKHATIHDSYLVYEIYPDGSLTVVFSPFRGYIHPEDTHYIKRVALNLRKNRFRIEKIFLENGITYSLPHNLTYKDFIDAIARSPEDDEYTSRFHLHVFSPSYYFPVTRHTGLWELRRAFVALYPILDNFITIARGEEYPLEVMLRRLMSHYFQESWYWGRRGEYIEGTQEFGENLTESSLPELESYRFIRAGIWWEILARDQWTCCSCGRSSKEHGIVLHVDHILPRSRGGTDSKENLQTLCLKCNIGKSNRDMTDLRRE